VRRAQSMPPTVPKATPLLSERFHRCTPAWRPDAAPARVRSFPTTSDAGVAAAALRCERPPLSDSRAEASDPASLPRGEAGSCGQGRPSLFAAIVPAIWGAGSTGRWPGRLSAMLDRGVSRGTSQPVSMVNAQAIPSDTAAGPGSRPVTGRLPACSSALSRLVPLHVGVHGGRWGANFSNANALRSRYAEGVRLNRSFLRFRCARLGTSLAVHSGLTRVEGPPAQSSSHPQRTVSTCYGPATRAGEDSKSARRAPPRSQPCSVN
jgi:hypothetical protein